MIEHEALLRAQLAQEENGVVLSGRLVDVLVSHLAKGAKAETKVPSGPEEAIAAAQAGWRATYSSGRRTMSCWTMVVFVGLDEPLSAGGAAIEDKMTRGGERAVSCATSGEDKDGGAYPDKKNSFDGFIAADLFGRSATASG